MAGCPNPRMHLNFPRRTLTKFIKYAYARAHIIKYCDILSFLEEGEVTALPNCVFSPLLSPVKKS